MEPTVSIVDRINLQRQMDTLLDMRALWNDGKTLDQIATQLGMSKTRVSRILRGLAYTRAYVALKVEPLEMRRVGRPRKQTRHLVAVSQ